MKKLKHIFPFIFILLLSYWSVRPFFINGFFPIHDDTQVARVFEMQKALTDGMFPVRWISDLGYNYGYPLFNFYAPFAYYIGGVFNLIGFDALIATKIMMVLGIVLASIFMYLFAKQFWGINGGIIAALLYLFAPYHGLNIYVRGDVAEFYGYAFIPLVFYGLWMVYKKREWKYVVIGSLGYAAIIASHNLTAMMITPFIFLFAAILYILARGEARINKPYYSLLILFLGIIVSAFYWLPVFAEMHYTNVLSQVGGGADYKDHYVCPLQLWESPWGFGGSVPGCIDGLSFKVGKVHLLLFVISLGLLFFWRKRKKIPLWLVLFSLVTFIVSVFFTLSQSQFIWDIIPQMAFIQYPWRFLLIITFITSFIGGAIMVLINLLPSHRGRYLIVGLVSIAIIYFNLEVFAPQTISPKTVTDYTEDSIISWNTSKISDEYMPKGFFKPQNKNQVPTTKFVKNNNVQILSQTEKTQLLRAEVNAKQKADILVNTAYFPAWHVFIDGEQVWFKHSNRGLLVTVPEGKHVIEVKFTQTLIEKVANMVSLTGVIALLLGIIFSSKQLYERKKA